MRMILRHIPILSDEAVFYAEQWVALAVGVVCLGTALWAGVYDYGLAGLAPRSMIGEHPFLLLNWSLTIASALIGVVLLRFAFRGRGRQKKAPEQERDETPTDNRGVSDVSNLAHATGNGGGE